MKSFLSLSAPDRYLYFVEASTRAGMFSPAIYEKDFWVCWTLKKLFGLPSLAQYMTFKGGTSLSKIYRIIERFSEDIDVSIHRSFFAFDGEKDPENTASSNERNRRLLALSNASANLIRIDLHPLLIKTFQEEINGNWRLEIDDKDSQTINFYYPSAIPAEQSQYIIPAVKIEFGARSDNWPQEKGTIVPYIAEVFSNEVGDIASANVNVLTKARTFWEKATILHAEYYRPNTSELPIRHSRHYYDLYCISKSPGAAEIIADRKLLDRVVQHKKVFFRSGWANYDSAVIGTLRLYPQSQQLMALEADYRSMRAMFYDTPPKLADILAEIKSVESRINGLIT